MHYRLNWPEKRDVCSVAHPQRVTLPPVKQNCEADTDVGAGSFAKWHGKQWIFIDYYLCNLIGLMINSRSSEEAAVSARVVLVQGRTQGEGPGGPGPRLGTCPALDFQGFFCQIKSSASLQHVCEGFLLCGKAVHIY